MSESFNEKTTAEVAANEFKNEIKGKVILLTGVSAGGLGEETAKWIAVHSPALLILAGRSLSKIEATDAVLKQIAPSVKTRSLVIDLASLDSVRAAAKEVNAYAEPIDVLINNAAIMATPYAVTVDGLEAQFATNHLGPSLFTVLIKERIIASAHPRVVNVSSMAQNYSDVHFDDIQWSKGATYDKWPAYGQSKSANAMFTVSLAEKWKADGVTAFSLHPGIIQTNLANSITILDQKKMGLLNEDGTPGSNYPWKSIPQGASTTIVAAFSPHIKNASGSYLFDAQLANEKAAEWALDPVKAEKLWKLSGEMVGTAYA